MKHSFIRKPISILLSLLIGVFRERGKQRHL